MDKKPAVRARHTTFKEELQMTKGLIVFMTVIPVDLVALVSHDKRDKQTSPYSLSPWVIEGLV